MKRNKRIRLLKTKKKTKKGEKEIFVKSATETNKYETETEIQ